MRLRLDPRSFAARAVAATAGLALRLSGRRAGVVLVYHAVAERGGDPRRELVPPHSRRVFEEQLRHLRRHYRVVTVQELQAAAAARRRGGRFPVALTFDDDLASHRTHVAPVLASLGLPATFFLTGATLDGPFSFWWERLQRAADLGLEVPVAGATVHERAAPVEAMAPAERAELDARLREIVGAGAGGAGLSRDDVAALTRAGFEIGFHTLRHDRLPDLDDEALGRALEEGRRELESAAGTALTSVAYPHGAADGRVAEAARAAGFHLGFTGRYEAVRATSDPLLLGRVEPGFGSAAPLALQLVALLRRAPHR